MPRGWLRMRRGLEALELIGGSAGRHALQRLAKESPGAEVRRHAADAAKRLERNR